MYQYYEDPLEPIPDPPSPSSSSTSCAEGHRFSLILSTEEGGCICLLCFSNLISNPSSPSFHVSYALSQLSHAVSQPAFLRRLLSFHFHLILSPLVLSLSSFNDDQVARQVTDLVSDLSDAGGAAVSGEFVARIADSISSGGLACNRRQLYSLHCLGVLLSRHTDTYTCIKDKAALIYNLVMGLQLPSEEIRGEIMFVLYRICLLLSSRKDEEGADVLLKYAPVLLYLSLDALMKTQRDDVRLNCIALLKALGERGFLSNAFSSDFNIMESCEADTYMQTTDGETNGTSLPRLFAEAIKSPLLSPDTQVQIAALDFIFHCLSRGDCSGKQIEVLVEENVADYIFEILRLSEQKDQVVSSCLQVLDLLSAAEHVFKQRLAIGFLTLISVLPVIAEVPFHPIQPQMLKLVLDGVSSFPGVVSTKLAEEISSALALMLKRHTAGMGMLSETFIAVCSIFVALVKSPSTGGASALMPMLQDASRNAVLASLSIYDHEPNQLLHSLYLLKEAYALSHGSNSLDSVTDTQLRDSVLEVCQKHILPWFVTTVNELEEESILGILETLHCILSQGHENKVLELTQFMLSLSWFHLSFRCLGLYPTERMRLRVYLLLSSIVDNIIGDDSGQSIRVAASVLPADPVDMLFLLGQKSTNNLELSSCQTAVLQILCAASIYDEMLADRQLVLASLEQYILANSSHLRCGAEGLITITLLLNLYGMYRGFAELSYQICYSPEAEKIFLQLVTEQDWDLLSFDIHPSSLKWLFQQERISNSLPTYILKLCRKSCSSGTQMNCQIPNFRHIAQLTATGDNLLPRVMVSLLEHLVGEEVLTDDLVSLLHLLSSMIYNFPDASNQLCLQGMGSVVKIMCLNFISSLSLENYTIISRFIFIILSSVHTHTLHDDEAWLAVIMKLLDTFTSSMTANGWTEEHLLVVSVLSLVLHHSTHGALIETSRFICLNTSLASLIRASIGELSTKGSNSNELDEGTDTEQASILLLLFYHFYLRSLQVALPGTIHWQDFLNQSNRTCTHPSMGILCQDLCKFLHFGSPMIKLVASYCLLEKLTGLSDPKNRQQSSLRCPVGYLRSMVAVLEGLVYDSNLRIAVNSCLCLSIILGWEIPGVHHTSLVRNNGWCRMIMEELAVSLAAPRPVSKSLMNHHRPAVHIAMALLKSKTTPPWMKSVFDEACLSGIIENLSPNNVSIEVVVLFQELLRSAFLKPDQVASLHQILQACRRSLCMESSEDESMGDQTRKLITMSGDLAEVSEFLLELMLSESHPDIHSGGSLTGNNRLAEEIDLFFRLLAENEDM